VPTVLARADSMLKRMPSDKEAATRIRRARESLRDPQPDADGN
jgi:hypothetical protein